MANQATRGQLPERVKKMNSAAVTEDVEELVKHVEIPDDLTMPLVIKFLQRCSQSLRYKSHTESAARIEAEAYGLMCAYKMGFLDDYGKPGSNRL